MKATKRSAMHRLLHGSTRNVTTLALRDDLESPKLQYVEADGFISREHLDQGIVVRIEEWINNVGRNIFRLWLQDTRFGQPVVYHEEVWDDATQIVFPYQFVLPPTKLTVDGTFQVWHQVLDDNGDSHLSAKVMLIVDIMDPNYGQRPTPVVVPAEIITDAYLTANGGITSTFVRAIDEKPPTDVIGWAWLKSEPTDWSSVDKLGFAPVDPADRSFTITKAQIEAAGSGAFYIVYAMGDRAGNETDMAISQPVTVLLGALPVVTREPYLVLEPEWDETVLDLLDACAGVQVMIDEYTGWAPGDFIHLTWGARELPAYYVQDNAVFPLAVPLDWPTLLSQYTVAEGPQATSFSYRVRRESVMFPPVGSAAPTGTIDVDLSVVGPGPLDPVDPPNPVLPTLAAITIKPPISGTDNVLEESDLAGVVNYEIELYDEVLDDHDIVIELGGYKLAPYVIDGELPGDTLRRELPWAFIKQLGVNGVFPARYSIGNPSMGVNRRWSEVTSLTINAFPVVLPSVHYVAPYDHPSYGPMIRCTELALTPNHAMHIHINPDNKYFTEGTKINLYYAPLKGIDGSGGPADPDWSYEELDLEWSLAETFLGKDWYIPYATVIKTYDVDEFHRCLSQVWYTLSVAGVPVPSPKGECIISLFRIANPGDDGRCKFTL